MLPEAVPIWVALGPVDLRWSFDILVGIVRDRLGAEPRSGLFVFLNRRADRAKVLFYDQSGWCLLYKRLDHGVFPLPATVQSGAVSVGITQRELQLMLLGRDLPRARRKSKPKNEPPILH